MNQKQFVWSFEGLNFNAIDIKPHLVNGYGSC